MTRRFYLGSSHISMSDGHSDVLTTLQEALDKAKESVEEGNREIAYVVEVVRIVRKANTPIIVEETR